MDCWNQNKKRSFIYIRIYTILTKVKTYRKSIRRNIEIIIFHVSEGYKKIKVRSVRKIKLFSKRKLFIKNIPESLKPQIIQVCIV